MSHYSKSGAAAVVSVLALLVSCAQAHSQATTDKLSGIANVQVKVIGFDSEATVGGLTAKLLQDEAERQCRQNGVPLTSHLTEQQMPTSAILGIEVRAIQDDKGLLI